MSRADRLRAIQRARAVRVTALTAVQLDVAVALAQDEAAKKAVTEIMANACAACGAFKWRWYPFCRRCSIRLQRVKMSDVLGSYERMLCRSRSWNQALRWYDVARDYLISSTKEPTKIGNKRGEEDGESLR